MIHSSFSQGGAPTQKLYQETMPKLALALNSRVFVKLTPMSSSCVPVQGEYLGASHYDFLIIRLPTIPGLVKQLLPRTSISISYLHSGAVNTFSSEVITYSFKPALLLFTSYPDRVSIMETRKHQRVTCALPVHLSTPHGEAEGVIQDLSMGGCRIVLEMTGQSMLRKLASGESVMLQSAFSSSGTASHGLGVVRNLETVGSRLVVGFSFDTGNKSFSDALAGYFDQVRVLEMLE